MLTQIQVATAVEDQQRNIVVLAMARQNRRVTTALAPLLPGMTLLILGSAIAVPLDVTLCLQCAAMVLFVIAAAFQARTTVEREAPGGIR